ncbi:MAG: methyltransferase [Bacteroidales bacterium]|jgi:tRNA1Val (adenine37-N6)-methyltransferase|nr:methyltransferase [Bacteroidales bacterium]
MSIFNFKQFSVSHEKSGIKIGTDAVLLGAIAPVENIYRALDIGTGCGVVALMLLQRGIPQMTAIEIDPEAAKEAQENARNSSWNDSVDIVCGNFCDKSLLKTLGTFDLIVSNPPFFTNALHSPDKKRNIARHTDALPFPLMLENVTTILNETGTFCVILPHSEAQNFITLAQINRLYSSKKYIIYSKSNLPPIREILFLQKNNIVSPKIQRLTIYNQDGGYSDDFTALTKYFYLNL